MLEKVAIEVRFEMVELRNKKEGPSLTSDMARF